MRTTEDIINILSTYKPYAERTYGLDTLGIFGSVARGEQTEESDVDICYSGKVLSLLTVDRLQDELSQILGCKVDIVRIYPGLKKDCRETEEGSKRD